MRFQTFYARVEGLSSAYIYLPFIGSETLNYDPVGESSNGFDFSMPLAECICLERVQNKSRIFASIKH